MAGQALDLLGQPSPGKRLEGPDNPGMDRSPLLQEQRFVGHLLGEGVLEGILVLGEEECLVEELGRLEVSEAGAD
jgi:hypothetical protein